MPLFMPHSQRIAVTHLTSLGAQDRSAPDGSHIAPVRFEGFTFVAPRALEGGGGSARGFGGAAAASGIGRAAASDMPHVGSSGRKLEFVPPVPVLHPGDPGTQDPDVGPIGSWTDVGTDDTNMG